MVCHVSVEYLVKLYLPAVVPEVRKLFTKNSWCKDDFLALPRGVEEDGEQGIYADFATGDIAFALDMDCDASIGSAGILKRRVDNHLSKVKRFTVVDLPEADRRSCQLFRTSES
jgi:hypothetical protein